MPSWNPSAPCNELPALPPNEELETRAVLKLCIDARSSLGELKQAAHRIPNQGMLINTLPLLEAKASSEIENIVTTTDKLFRNVGSEDQADPATKEALRYSRALFEGYKTLGDHPISTRTAENICSTIKGVEMRVRSVPGTTLVNSATQAKVDTPPSGEKLLRDMMANWEQFIHAEDGLDPLVRLAVSHYQFEAIHPFTDGNGRTGRVINSLLLIKEGLLNLPILYLSRFIIANRAEYYDLLQQVTRDHVWEPWVLYILRGIAETAKWTTAKIDAINNLSAHTKEFVFQANPAIGREKLIDLIFRSPYCRISDVVVAGIAQRQTASTYLRRLADLGVLSEIDGTREKLFVHPKLLNLIGSEDNTFIPYDATVSAIGIALRPTPLL
ncbi:Fic family protein [Aestuariivirga sp.]|uniref:protein adenylyltransferase Fic n=1 Tax=Aestuariivirga sp. TaxID=2650926 RepID=UPI00301606A8